MLRRFLLVILCSVPMTAVVCRADQVSFATATTQGCFSSTTCTASSTKASTSAGDLSFAGASFGGTTGTPATNGQLTILLGQFTLTDATTTIIDKNFYSKITFTLPVTINGGQSTSAFSADIWGVVLKNTFGFVDIDFNTPTQHFTFQNSEYTGSFDFNVGSLEFGLLGKGSDTVSWKGYITNAVETPIAPISAPEPGALMLLMVSMAGTGVIGKVKARRSR